MCNRYGNKISYDQYVAAFTDLGLKLVQPNGRGIPNLQPRAQIFPTETAPVIRPHENGLEVIELRWGLIPWFHKGHVKEWKPLTTNARRETIATTATYKSAFQRHRCLIPFSHFFEWTGEKGHKTQWQFNPKENDWLCFAGIWDRAQTADGIVESFSLATMPAGKDVEKIHDRQPVVLLPAQYAQWLESPQAADLLLQSPPENILTVEKYQAELAA